MVIIIIIYGSRIERESLTRELREVMMVVCEIDSEEGRRLWVKKSNTAR